MTKKTVICPKCNTPIGLYPKVRFMEVRLDCWNCGTSLVAKANHVLGNIKTPTTISMDSNQRFVDENSWSDPISQIQSKIDRDLFLDKLSPEDREICIMREEGYTYTEIGEKFGLTRQAIQSRTAKIGRMIKKDHD